MGTSIFPFSSILIFGISKSVTNGVLGNARGNSKYGIFGTIAARCNSAANPITWHQVCGTHSDPNLYAFSAIYNISSNPPALTELGWTTSSLPILNKSINSCLVVNPQSPAAILISVDSTNFL